MERNNYINKKNQTLLISNIRDSEQSSDLSVPANCKGFGRIRHFYRKQQNWLDDPLPIDPACKALELQHSDMIEAQVFQLGYCNMNCWYCFVPDELRNGINGQWLSVEDLLELYLNESKRPKVIDLSGGNPELTPEWVLWWMRTIKNKNLENKLYLWSDDTLSTNSMYQFLTKKEIEEMADYKNYGKVCCFKGFDEESYFFNCRYRNGDYNNQFYTISKYILQGFDIFAYVTITCSNLENIEKRIKQFFDDLQSIHELLPLRTIPLKIVSYGPTQSRMKKEHFCALQNQFIVKDIWNSELHKRFSTKQLEKNISDLRLD